MKHSILIFDSGVGGLSILSEIRKQFPTTHLHYLMDCEWFPYGTRNDDDLQQRIVSLCCTSVRRLQPDLLVLACNTASTLALEALRANLSIPVVGVVPAIKVAADQYPDSEHAEIGLLATPATVNRVYTERLIRDFAPHCTVHRLGSSELVQLSEDWISGRDIRADLTSVLHDWLQQYPLMTHVVLGCTHFPLLRPLLEELWPRIHWIDSGQAVALQAGRVYPGDHNTGQGSSSLWWTSPAEAQDSASEHNINHLSIAGAEDFLRKLGPLESSSQLHTQENRLIQSGSSV